MLAMEFLVDKVPGLDTLWDAVHTFIRIPAGALLAAGATGDSLTAMTVVAGLLGRHHHRRHALHQGGSRAVINTSPEPVSNWGAVVHRGRARDGRHLARAHHPIVFLVFLASLHPADDLADPDALARHQVDHGDACSRAHLRART
jgi:hypothetical protein